MSAPLLILWLAYWTLLTGFAGVLNRTLADLLPLSPTDASALLFFAALFFWVLVPVPTPAPAAAGTNAASKRGAAMRRFAPLLEVYALLTVSLLFGLSLADRLGAIQWPSVLQRYVVVLLLLAFFRVLAEWTAAMYHLVLALFVVAPPLCLWLADQTQLARTGLHRPDSWVMQYHPLHLLAEAEWSPSQCLSLGILLALTLFFSVFRAPSASSAN